MIVPRAVGAVITTVPAATAAIVTDQGARSVGPTIWAPLGYPFEAGSMIAALCACLAVRFYVNISAGEHRWQLDMPVSALALMFTAAAIIHQHPDPLIALFYGTGFGILGAGIIAIAKKYLDQALTALGIVSPPQKGGIDGGAPAPTGKDPT